LNINTQDINEISTRYSNAIILVSENTKNIEEIKKNFSHFISLLKKNKEFLSITKSPMIKNIQKANAIEKISKKFLYSKIFKGFLITVTKHGKLPMIERIYFKFQEFLNRKNGITKVTITTASPLQKDAENEIKKKLETRLKLKIELNKIVDPEIIGGTILKIKSIMTDNSVRSKLINCKTSMKGYI